MHEIFADPKKLRAPNTMNGKVGKKEAKFSVTFEPGKTVKVKDDEFKALMADKGGILSILLKDETLMERKSGDEEEPPEDSPPDSVKEAEDALMAAEDGLVKATNAEEKKAALADVKAAKKVLTAAQKAAKKA